MSYYRITEFTSPDMNQATELSETLRGDLKDTGAEFIDIVSVGEHKGLVIAKYADEATMEAASDTAKQVFGKMIELGAIDGSSIVPRSGPVRNSF